MYSLLWLLFLNQCWGWELRGVQPFLVDRYNESKFRCFDTNKVVSVGVVNDNYCDCDDCSDEPGTSAMTLTSINVYPFFCPNIGFLAKNISHSKVDDGICDCCDGSDEPQGHCNNTCLEDHYQALEAQNRERELRERAMLRKMDLAGESMSMLNNLRARRDLLVQEARNKELPNHALINVRDSLSQAEALLADIHMSPTDNVKEQIENYFATKTKAWNNQSLAGILYGFVAEIYTLTADTLVLAYYKLGDSWLGSNRACCQEELASLQQQLSIDYGKDNEFLPFYRKEYRAYHLENNYTIVLFSHAMQDQVSLGEWKGWQTNSDGSSNYSIMTFEGGTRCWNGAARNLRVIFNCGEVDELVSVKEPKMCSYVATVNIPAACQEHQEL